MSQAPTRWDPDSYQTLQNERDALLSELEEVDGQLKSGEIDPDQHRVLTERLTAEAARVILALEKNRPVMSSARPIMGRIAVVGAVVVAVLLTGWFLIGQLAPRQPFGSLDTGVSSTEQRAARLADVLADDPTNISARMAYARFLIQLEDLPEAVRQFDEVVSQEPDNVEALTYGGWVAVLAGVEGGLDRLDRAIETEPRYPDAWALRGLARMRAGRTNEASGDLDRYLEIVPQGPLADEVRQVLARLGGG